ncbi:polysaccharide deacetylase family protein [Chitinimonas arctica]|uniref:Polysaccharide deacetylase family protein n=1 Tax=Chitinimonas arctica TaxID=2594795 RepID=A0A516SAZ9_9NEIS|nr:polysaccharide deacetylase family protein [Chitinimonas arctica]QDQ25248.1 polysaccharide deacetylase family protein [Chitinimonas arctica]
MLLALRIEVDSLAAARDITPRLLGLLRDHDAKASFFFAMGPDRSGRTGGPLFEVGESRQQIRLNRQLNGPRGAARWYGSLIPAPELVKHAADAIRAVRDAGFETGLRGWDRVNWIKCIAGAEASWVRGELEAACHAYEAVLGEAPHAIALPGWRVNRAALRLEQQLGLHYASDTRGKHPFLPVIEGEPVRVLQLPTTLPTLSELIGAGNRDGTAAVDDLLAMTERIPLTGHVFTIQAHGDGGKRLPLLQRLLAGWREQGLELASLQRLSEILDPAKLPWHTVELRAWPGHGGLLALQGEAFPG